MHATAVSPTTCLRYHELSLTLVPHRLGPIRIGLALGHDPLEVEPLGCVKEISSALLLSAKGTPPAPLDDPTACSYRPIGSSLLSRLSRNSPSGRSTAWNSLQTRNRWPDSEVTSPWIEVWAALARSPVLNRSLSVEVI
jgi:hypothetical protein